MQKPENRPQPGPTGRAQIYRSKGSRLSQPILLMPIIQNRRQLSTGKNADFFTQGIDLARLPTDPEKQKAENQPPDHLAPGVAHQFPQPSAIHALPVQRTVHQVVQHSGLLPDFLTQTGRLKNDKNAEDQDQTEDRRIETIRPAHYQDQCRYGGRV